MINYSKQAKRIYKEVLAQHKKGAITTTVKFRLKVNDSANMAALKIALRNQNKRLVWAWNWPEYGLMRIHVAQKRALRSGHS